MTKKIVIFFISMMLFIATPISAFDGFSDIFEEPEAPVVAQSAINVDGKVSFSIEAIAGENDPLEGRVNIGGGLDIDLSWRGSMVDARTSFTLNPSAQTEFAWYDVFTGLSLTAFYENGFVEAGLLKKEWGSGDGVHVVDVLNAPDYRKGIVDDTLAMKVAEPMVTTTTTWTNTKFEFVYKPMLVPMMAAQEGDWALATSIPYDDAFTAPSYEELAHLKNGQIATRVKRTIGPADIGLIYFNGFIAQPGYILSGTYPNFKISDLIFTRYNLFGGEATIIAGPVTFMLEGGFWLSEDHEGTDPTKYNNKVVYLGGIGYLFPDTGAYTSLTYNGQYILDFPAPGTDVDYLQAQQSSDGKAYMNTITAALELPLSREQVTVRLAGTYQIETTGFAFLPSITWRVTDDFVVTAAGRIFGAAENKDSIFNTWKSNDSLKMSISYLF
jgi:hypothetical protein